MYYKEAKMNTNVINEGELLERVDYDYELLRELYSVFMEDIPQQLNEIEEAINKKEPDKVKALIHRLKGAVGNLSAEYAYELAAKMEMHASLGELSSLQYFYPDLKKQILLAVDALGLLIKSNGS